MREFSDGTGGKVHVVPATPWDYEYARHAGSHLLRCCALCGSALEYCGETSDEERERNAEPWGHGDGADCIPMHKYENRDALLDSDDHDRCQCEGKNR